MKNILTIFACVAVLAFTSCESKKEKDAKAAAIAQAKADSTSAANAAALEERRSRIKRERDEYSERRRVSNDERNKKTPTYKDAKGKKVYYVSEVLPSFRGSQDELEQYIQDNINYPSSAQNDKVEGTVFVEFVVGSDGAIRDVEVVETTSDAVKQQLSEEAVRVVSNMPTWTAGTQGGKPVDVRVTLPITFQLEM